MVRFCEKTPLVDGGGLKNTLENRVAAFLDKKNRRLRHAARRKVLVALGVDRWGSPNPSLMPATKTIFGDFMFGLDIRLPFITHRSRPLPRWSCNCQEGSFCMVYPTGESRRSARQVGKYYAWATVIGGDFHNIKRFMPDDLGGKVISANTTPLKTLKSSTRQAWKYLVTTTPVLEGRSSERI